MLAATMKKDNVNYIVMPPVVPQQQQVTSQPQLLPAALPAQPVVVPVETVVNNAAKGKKGGCGAGNAQRIPMRPRTVR
jgi:hypothetical protein